MLFKEIPISPEVRTFPSRTLSQTPDVENFITAFRKCCQLRSTDDRRHFITLSIHICVQHDGQDAARHLVHLLHLQLVLFPSESVLFTDV